ncbi:uncharacterized protein N7482_010707 [Penicillium canariense]|uniref:Rhodopsin domain-containing protein n=1 Tax=Penicillium canariense TaxID=189055 RepID=A0A9W9HME6_9EURO|nr:uncharacterized protein N7482_010707 [Penicillium canariense]KAJ5151455.1 hypothetical protein N7482_010707 [Penicillium canariense]
MSNDKGPALERSIWAGVIIAAVIVFLRVVAKIKIKRFHVDDVLMIIAEILIIVSTVFLTLSVKHGFGSNLLNLDTQDQQLVLKYILFQVTLVTFSTTIARSAFIIYLLAVLSTNKAYVIVLWILLFIQAAGNIVAAVLPLTICRNVAAMWSIEAAMDTTCGDTGDVINFAYYSNSFNSATDLFLVIFPTLVFWNLNLKLGIKISLIGLLSLGSIAMVASIIKTTKLDQVPGLTNLGATVGLELMRWGYIENTIIIITSSIPCIRPLIISSVRKFSSVTRSYELSGRFSGHRTAGNDTSQSRLGRSRRFTKSHNAENGSVEHILEHIICVALAVGLCLAAFAHWFLRYRGRSMEEVQPTTAPIFIQLQSDRSKKQEQTLPTMDDHDICVPIVEYQMWKIHQFTERCCNELAPTCDSEFAKHYGKFQSTGAASSFSR